MKIFFNVTFSVLPFLFIACAPSHPDKRISISDATQVIYQGDSREDVHPHDPHQHLAHATAILFKGHRLLPGAQDQSFRLKTIPLEQNYPLCSNEPFLAQPTLGFCSGVLIAPNKVLTAGHCLGQNEDCRDIKFTFGWTLAKAQQDSLDRNDFYTCKAILAQRNSPRAGLDYAVLELDRNVTSAVPVRIAKQTSRQKGDKLISLSYPLGLPLKKDMARVLSAPEEGTLIKVEVDTFMGSSGSPLFDEEGELVGILSMGMADILEDDIYRVQKHGGCINFNRCQDGLCFGESFFKASRIGE